MYFGINNVLKAFSKVVIVGTFISKMSKIILVSINKSSSEILFKLKRFTFRIELDVETFCLRALNQ